MKKGEPINTGPIKKFLLHFNIFNTISLADPSGQLTKEENLMENLVNYAWGRPDEKNPNLWKLAHNSFTKIAPQMDLISYRQFVFEQNPLLTEEEEQDESVRNEKNQETIKKRKELFYNLVKPGQPGIKLKPDMDKILKHIALPRIVVEEMKIPKEGEVQKESLKDQESLDDIQQKVTDYKEKNPLFDLFVDSKYYLLPNFFRTMNSLKKQKREFAVCFRSFDNDLKNVITEFNKFCQGEHPCYNGRNNFPLARFDGSKGSKNFIISKENQIMYYRKSKEVSDLTAIFGNLNRVQEVRNLEDQYEKEIEDEGVQLLQGAPEIYIKTLEVLKDSCAIAIQDDRRFWEENARNSDAGRPLLIDLHDYTTLQIFFDTSLSSDEESTSLDVRDVITGQKVPIRKSQNKYTVRVELIDVIKDPDFFIKMIDLCEKSRLDEIEKIEKGISEDVEEQPKKSEWDLLQEATDQDYLRKTVMPLLQPALQLIDIERPNDPISFIAVYMLKNKENVKIPQPPVEENQDESQQDIEKENQNQEVEQHAEEK